jgi:hypothetical protein
VNNPALIEGDGGHGNTEQRLAMLNQLVDAWIQAKEITPAEEN